MIKNLKEAIRIIEIQKEIEQAEKNGETSFRINHLDNKIAKILKEVGLLE